MAAHGQDPPAFGGALVVALALFSESRHGTLESSAAEIASATTAGFRHGGSIAGNG